MHGVLWTKSNFYIKQVEAVNVEIYFRSSLFIFKNDGRIKLTSYIFKNTLI
jgi:hypothetical protein